MPDFKCMFCGKTTDQVPDWPKQGDTVPFRIRLPHDGQTLPGTFHLEQRCPRCGKSCFVVWDDDPTGGEPPAAEGRDRPDVKRSFWHRLFRRRSVRDLSQDEKKSIFFEILHETDGEIALAVRTGRVPAFAMLDQAKAARYLAERVAGRIARKWRIPRRQAIGILREGLKNRWDSRR